MFTVSTKMFDLFTKTKIFSGLTSKQWVNEKMEFSGKQTIALLTPSAQKSKNKRKAAVLSL